MLDQQIKNKVKIGIIVIMIFMITPLVIEEQFPLLSTILYLFNDVVLSLSMLFPLYIHKKFNSAALVSKEKNEILNKNPKKLKNHILLERYSSIFCCLVSLCGSILHFIYVKI